MTKYPAHCHSMFKCNIIFHFLDCFAKWSIQECINNIFEDEMFHFWAQLVSDSPLNCAPSNVATVGDNQLLRKTQKRATFHFPLWFHSLRRFLVENPSSGAGEIWVEKLFKLKLEKTEQDSCQVWRKNCFWAVDPSTSISRVAVMNKHMFSSLDDKESSQVLGWFCLMRFFCGLCWYVCRSSR